jgi:predicted small secreted protein
MRIAPRRRTALIRRLACAVVVAAGLLTSACGERTTNGFSSHLQSCLHGRGAKVYRQITHRHGRGANQYLLTVGAYSFGLGPSADVFPPRLMSHICGELKHAVLSNH